MSTALPSALRPRGGRSPRGRAAILVALAALVPLPLMRTALNGAMESGVRVGGRAPYEYSLGELPALLVATSVLLSVMIAVAAAGLWAARDRRVLALTVAAGIAGAAGTVVLTPSTVSEPVTATEHRAVPLDISRAELEDRLGWPAGSGSATTDRLGVMLDCAVYRGTELWQHPMYCFDGDRLARKVWE